MSYLSALQKLSKNLVGTYNNTLFAHSGNIGDTREKVVINYLSSVMAKKYGFQSGEVFDENDNNSGQVDIIIYDNLFSTIFSDGSNKIFAPVESTYGIISVKSQMGTKELDNAIDGIKKYNDLKRPLSEDNVFYVMPDLKITAGTNIQLYGQKQKNINCIFAFESKVAISTILKKMRQNPFIDMIIVPDHFCILGRHRNEFGLSKGKGNIEYVAIENNYSVALFVLILQIYLSQNRLISKNLNTLIMKLIHESPIKLE